MDDIALKGMETPHEERIGWGWKVIFAAIVVVGTFIVGAINGHDAALRHMADLHRGQVSVTFDDFLWSQEGIEKGLRCVGEEGGTVHIGGGEYEIRSTLNVPGDVSLKGDSVIPPELSWQGDSGPVLEITRSGMCRDLCGQTEFSVSNLHVYDADTAFLINEEGG